MTITDLPDELILHAFNKKAVDVSSRCSPIRINRRIQQLVVPIIYRSISFCSLKSKRDNLEKSRLRSLQRRFRKMPI